MRLCRRGSCSVGGLRYDARQSALGPQHPDFGQADRDSKSAHSRALQGLYRRETSARNPRSSPRKTCRSRTAPIGPAGDRGGPGASACSLSWLAGGYARPVRTVSSKARFPSCGPKSGNATESILVLRCPRIGSRPPDPLKRSWNGPVLVVRRAFLVPGINRLAGPLHIPDRVYLARSTAIHSGRCRPGILRARRNVGEAAK